MKVWRIRQIGLLFLMVFGVWGNPWAEVASTSGCLRCHSKPLWKELPSGKQMLLKVDADAFRKSVHAEISCTECHPGTKEVPHLEGVPTQPCQSCHQQESRSFESSIHGRAGAAGIAEIPKCETCHGVHDVYPPSDPRSPVHRSRVIPLCVSCHTEKSLTEKYNLKSPEEVHAYERSVHGQLALAGHSEAPVCTDCHGTHGIAPGDDPTSALFKPKIPRLCGHCHQKEAAEYAKGIHGEALARGILDAPACTDCHGEHLIVAPDQPGSKVAAANVPRTCGSCHESVKLAERYRIPARRLSTFMDSYHGVALKYGETYVANCASCHKYHQILPSSNPESPIYPGNLPQTCGQCHPGISRKVTMGKVHVEPRKEVSKGRYYVRKFYTYFISFLMAGFVLYIVLETVGSVRRRRMRRV